MITVKIGQETREVEAVSPQWLHEAIESRRHNGADSSVLIKIVADDVDIALRAPAGPGKGSVRELSKAEDYVLDRWTHLGLSSDGFSIDALYKFLREMRGFS
jgi:hypothetical protein